MQVKKGTFTSMISRLYRRAPFCAVIATIALAASTGACSSTSDANTTAAWTLSGRYMLEDPKNVDGFASLHFFEGRYEGVFAETMGFEYGAYALESRPTGRNHLTLTSDTGREHILDVSEIVETKATTGSLDFSVRRRNDDVGETDETEVPSCAPPKACEARNGSGSGGRIAEFNKNLAIEHPAPRPPDTQTEDSVLNKSGSALLSERSACTSLLGKAEQTVAQAVTIQTADSEVGSKAVRDGGDCMSDRLPEQFPPSKNDSDLVDPQSSEKTKGNADRNNNPFDDHCRLGIIGWALCSSKWFSKYDDYSCVNERILYTPPGGVHLLVQGTPGFTDQTCFFSCKLRDGDPRHGNAELTGKNCDRLPTCGSSGWEPAFKEGMRRRRVCAMYGNLGAHLGNRTEYAW